MKRLYLATAIIGLNLATDAMAVYIGSEHGFGIKSLLLALATGMLIWFLVEKR